MVQDGDKIMASSTDTPYLIAGKWLQGGDAAKPVDFACREAQDAFSSFGWTRTADTALHVHAIVVYTDTRAEKRACIRAPETDLPAVRRFYRNLPDRLRAAVPGP